jgi:hypothetical protein
MDPLAVLGTQFVEFVTRLLEKYSKSTKMDAKFIKVDALRCSATLIFLAGSMPGAM